MKILVTGGGGQLGSEWGRQLRKQKKHKFRILGRKEMDITELHEFQKEIIDFDPDVIVNTAAYTAVDLAENHSEEAYAVNRDGVKNLAALCKERGIKLVHYSTDYVFAGNKEDEKKFPKGYLEDSERNPNNVYGHSKKEGEDALFASGCDYLLIRVAWLCGVDGKNFVKTMLRLADDREYLQVVDDQTGTPSFCKGVVENTLMLLQQQKSGTYHLATTRKVSWYDFAKEIFRLSSRDVTVEAINSKQFIQVAERPAFSVLNTEKISKIEGIKLCGLSEALKILLKELKELNEN